MFVVFQRKESMGSCELHFTGSEEFSTYVRSLKRSVDLVLEKDTREQGCLVIQSLKQNFTKANGITFLSDSDVSVLVKCENRYADVIPVYRV